MKLFQAELSKRPILLTSASITIEDKYAEFVEYVKKTRIEIFHQDGNGKKQKEWLKIEILETVNKKAQAFLEW